MTLLVLPLVEIASDLDEHSEVGVWDLLAEYQNEILAFVISFLVAWGLWRSHHRIMDGFRGYDTTIVMGHLLWLMTIVLLAFTTQLLTAGDLYDRGAPALYIGNLLVSSIALTGIQWHGHERPELLADDRDPADFDMFDTFSTAGVLTLCLALAHLAGARRLAAVPAVPRPAVPVGRQPDPGTFVGPADEASRSVRKRLSAALVARSSAAA